MIELLLVKIINDLNCVSISLFTKNKLPPCDFKKRPSHFECCLASNRPQTVKNLWGYRDQ